MGTLVPTAVAAHAMGVTPDAIRVLRHRGKLTRHGSKQRALVDIDELTELVAQRGGQVEQFDVGQDFHDDKDRMVRA